MGHLLAQSWPDRQAIESRHEHASCPFVVDNDWGGQALHGGADPRSDLGRQRVDLKAIRNLYGEVCPEKLGMEIRQKVSIT
jgi:hypothetical protein